MKKSLVACGKWVLSGEHSVIRGEPAMAFPLLNRTMVLDWDSEGENAFISDDYPAFGEILRHTLYRGIELCGKAVPEKLGQFSISSTIPIGVGLGSSSALCLLVSKWLRLVGYIKKSQILEFAIKLENVFHGCSSGMDVTVAFVEKPILFSRSSKPKTFKVKWKPYLYMNHSGVHASTSSAVEKCSALNNKELDIEMGMATKTCFDALVNNRYCDDSVYMLANGINDACSCFEKWGLIPSDMKSMMERFSGLGAIATKPTGSGNGGFVLSLWMKKPPKHVLETLTPLF